MKTFLSLLFGFFILSATLVGQVPVLLSDLNQGSADGMDEFNSQGVALGDKMFLVANNGLTGLELYAIENNLAGSILGNYKLLQNSRLQIVGEVFLPIDQHLMATLVRTKDLLGHQTVLQKLAP